MTVIRSVCVFCGSRVGENPEFRAAARRLGELLATHNLRLVYGGGSIGLMGVLADAVLANGGEVHGVIPRFLDRIEVGHRRVTSLDVVESMHERKAAMFEMADAFIVLPGGLGTLDETIEIVTWRQLGLHDKPIIVVDHKGYWEPLLALVDHTVREGFAGKSTRELFHVVSDVRSVLPALKVAAEDASGKAAPAKVL
ncbi:MAG: TIGR00730 family Rossman fold protein [Alphaproteobacteria bacterium]|nr:TIGR00730 family Rossman fold protein [Alphaproteobacteria bacterium]MBM4438156.1 TIGR00730 family Rossman fold protein [Actinomycetota bacterium]